MVQPGQVGAGALGAVAVHHRLGDLPTALGLWGEVVERLGATTASPLVAGLTSAAQMTSLSGSTATWALSPSTPWAAVLWPWRAWGSTVEMTRSGAVPSKMRKRPSSVSSMSWPVTVANNVAASAVRSSSRSPRRA